MLWISPSAGIAGKCDFDTPFRKNSENSGKPRDFPLFPLRPNPREPRISAKNQICPADNFLQKQQKQREANASASDA